LTHCIKNVLLWGESHMIRSITNIWSSSSLLICKLPVHSNWVNVSLSIKVNRIKTLSLQIFTNFELFKVKMHRNWGALNVIRPPAEEHIRFHTVLTRITNKVHWRHQLQDWILILNFFLMVFTLFLWQDTTCLLRFVILKCYN
jgi:hypothetical protein